MRKKFIAFMLITAAALGTTALAEESITARTNDKSVVFTRQSWMEEHVILSCYDTDGILKYSNVYKSENNEFKADIPPGFWDMQISACFINTGRICDVEVSSETITTPAPTLSPTLAPSPSAEPAEEKSPEVYKSSLAAKTAFAVVDSIAEAVEDGENCYVINLLYQGEEQSITVNSDMEILTAPDAFSYMEGQNVKSLKRGDAIYFTQNAAKTKIREISLIYRPVNEELALTGEDYGEGFAKLISRNGLVAGRKEWNVLGYNAAASAEYQYAFGIITDKSSSLMTLYPKSGMSGKAAEIDLDKNTVVYSCDMSGKNKLEITKTGGIIKSFIPKTAYDDEDNITFSEDCQYNYALVRLVDNVAADIIVYLN